MANECPGAQVPVPVGVRCAGCGWTYCGPVIGFEHYDSERQVMCGPVLPLDAEDSRER